MSAVAPAFVRLAPFVGALLLTIAFELPLGLACFCERTPYAARVVALAQIATNPVVELVCQLCHWNMRLTLASPAWVALLAAELAACAVEALLYRMADITEHPWRMSCALNAMSFCGGLALQLLLTR